MKQSFLLWMDRRQLSGATIDKYMRYLEKFQTYGEFSQLGIDRFLTDNNNNVARSFVRALIKFLLRNPTSLGLTREQEDNIKGVVIDSLKTKRQRPKKVITLEDLYKIEAHIKTERDKILLLLSFYCGLRISEVLSFKVSDFEWKVWLNERQEKGTVTFIGKGGNYTSCYVPPFLMHRLLKYLQKYNDGKETQLFKLDKVTWRRHLYKASEKAIGRRINPHLLRHSFATYLINKGKDMLVVKEALRHKDISSTQVYTHMSKDRLSKEIDSAFDL